MGADPRCEVTCGGHRPWVPCIQAWFRTRLDNEVPQSAADDLGVGEVVDGEFLAVLEFRDKSHRLLIAAAPAVC